MTPTQRKAMEQALEALGVGREYAFETAEQFHIEMKGYKQQRHDAMDAEVKQIDQAITALRAALAEPQGEPFKPDWVNYRQGLHDGWAEGYDQGVADERTSEDNIGIAGFGAKVNPARENPYKSTAPQPTKQPLTDDEIARIWTNNHRTLGGWDHGGDTVMYESDFADAVQAIEEAHGIRAGGGV